jgi:hypothetical protein
MIELMFLADFSFLKVIMENRSLNCFIILSHSKKIQSVKKLSNINHKNSEIGFKFKRSYSINY